MWFTSFRARNLASELKRRHQNLYRYAELRRHFHLLQKEKVADTKHKLQALVTSTPKAMDKSLLLQSVALFETLLSKIHDLQAENEGLKTDLATKKGGLEETTAEKDNLVIELEAARKELEHKTQVIIEWVLFFVSAFLENPAHISRGYDQKHSLPSHCPQM